MIDLGLKVDGYGAAAEGLGSNVGMCGDELENLNSEIIAAQLICCANDTKCGHFRCVASFRVFIRFYPGFAGRLSAAYLG